MKKIIAIIVGLIIIGIAYYYVDDYLCKCEIKCKNCPEISESSKFSKEAGLYVGNYISNPELIHLKYNNEKIIITNVWFEKSWLINTDNCSSQKIEKTEGYNVVLEFKKTSEEFIFDLMPITDDVFGENSYGTGDNRKEMRFKNLPENLKIVVSEKNPDKNIGWKESIVTDTIFLSLKKNKL
jgi:hypothetical protein